MVAGVLLILSSIALGVVAVWRMVTSESYAMTLIRMVPVMFLAFVLLTAGSVFLTT